MNLRGAENYIVGLDLGTGSVGWAVVDEDGKPYHYNGRPTLGARIFPSAQTAAERRVKRGQRRRYERRRQRLERLQEIFAAEMSKVDAEFFIRLRQSALLPEDRDRGYDVDYRHPFFNSQGFTDKDYYRQFPTIWHLRKHLQESNEQVDLRLIYLALHNIVKYRGHFIREDEANLSAANADAKQAATNLIDATIAYLEDNAPAGGKEITCLAEPKKIQEIFENSKIKRSERAEKLQDALKISDKEFGKRLARACFGYKVKYHEKLFFDLEASSEPKTEFELSDDEAVEKFLEICPDSAQELFGAIQAAYSTYVLGDVLKGASSLSAAMIKSYEAHEQDLKDLKYLFKTYASDYDSSRNLYQDMFGGAKLPDGKYDINKLNPGSYTAYVCGESLANKKGCSQADLVKNLKKLFGLKNQARGNRSANDQSANSADSSAGFEVLDPAIDPKIKEDPKYQEIAERLIADEGQFLAKQKTRVNGAIPFQLHLEEMERIIEQQGEHYPFLLEHREDLTRLVKSRIPYYVGPLVPKRSCNEDAADKDERRRFAWSVRKPGMEQMRAYPWNVDEVIDKEQTAEQFIRRMTGKCTYLIGEDVLPKASLLYQEYCVLNELNGVRFSLDGKAYQRFDAADRQAMVAELFKKQKSVTHKHVADWFLKRRGHSNQGKLEIVGTQGESKFESKLDSYVEFCKILGVDGLESDNCSLTQAEIEQIILWSTLFEDKEIRRSRLEKVYEKKLTSKQIEKLSKKRFSGWGRLSQKFLTGIKVDTNQGKKSIIDILRDGNPTIGQTGRALVLMEILSQDFDFQAEIERVNQQILDDRGMRLNLDDMQGSPALRRTINQAMRVLDEIVKIAGNPPAKICLEVTREEDSKKKGKRTKTRYDLLTEAYKKFQDDAKELLGTGECKQLRDQLKSKETDLKGAKASERLVLYFAQGGKCLYSGKALEIDRLSEYQVDHIIPQCYVKDDSLDNKALVLASENQRKSDSLLLDRNIINRRQGYWKALKDADLISAKKYKNLTCKDITDRMAIGFINRQLVETSQIVKFVRQLCEQEYVGTDVVSIKASQSGELRRRLELPKVRELNDFHHAHDAFLICQLARFIDLRYPQLLDRRSAEILQRYVRSVSKLSRTSSKGNYGKSGFIIDSFFKNGTDPETGEVFKDTWLADEEIRNIKQVFAYKNCYLSRMVEEQTAELWDATVYSPRDSKNGKNLFPLKGTSTARELNPARYGGYNKVKQAFFFLFSALNNKGEEQFFFEGMPVYLAKTIEVDSDALLAYAQQIAVAAARNKVSKKSKSLDVDAIRQSVRILRKKIPLRQKFELDGSEFYLYGRSGSTNELRSAIPIVVDNELARKLDKIVKIADERNVPSEYNSLTDNDYLNVCQYLSKKLGFTCPLLASALKLSECESAFEELSSVDKAQVIVNILKVANGDSKGCDLKLVAGAKAGSRGFIRKNLASPKVIQEITWIDQSVTGMFETRTTFQDLINGV